jgi:hypothetical protein
MKRLLIAAALGLLVVFTTGPAFAKPRFTVIHVTKNYNTSLFPAECLGSITTETLPSLNMEDITWVIKNGNGNNNDDVCPNIDKSLVELHFKDDVMGTAAMRVLKSQQVGGVWRIKGTVDAGIPKGAYKYFVFYKGLQAGPDPEIEVACDSCGGGGIK